MSNKCLITGASGALGGVVANHLSSNGYETFLIDRSKRENIVVADLGDWDATKTAVDQVFKQAGEVDLVVHCAGGFRFSAIDEISDADVKFLVEANFLSTANLLRACIPHLKKQSRSCIVAIGANAAFQPGPGMGFYAASKAALHALVQSCARENFEFGIRTNAILPAIIDTPQNRKDMPDADFSQWVSPQEIASLISDLASDSNSKLNGALIPLAGKLV